MKSKNIFYSILLVLGLLLFYKYIYDGTEHLISNVDSRYYKVRPGALQQRKADLLAMLNIKFTIIVKALNNDPIYINNIAVQRLIKNWNRGITIKETGIMESDAAYVMNKQNMSFCLQDSPDIGCNAKNINIEDTNLITYVGIHELSHCMSNESGHGPEFIKNFEFLLNYSKKLMYLDPFTNKETPLYIQLDKLNTADNYCGVPLVNSIN